MNPVIHLYYSHLWLIFDQSFRRFTFFNDLGHPNHYLIHSWTLLLGWSVLCPISLVFCLQYVCHIDLLYLNSHGNFIWITIEINIKAGDIINSTISTPSNFLLCFNLYWITIIYYWIIIIYHWIIIIYYDDNPIIIYYY